jgi:hypothetical protein
VTPLVSWERCPECQKLTVELGSATMEAVAIEHEIQARIRASIDVSQNVLRWLEDAEARWHEIREELHTHTRTHHPK